MGKISLLPGSVKRIYRWRYIVQSMKFQILRVADMIVFRRTCDAYDLALGVPDTPENFPDRHVRKDNVNPTTP